MALQSWTDREIRPLITRHVEGGPAEAAELLERHGLTDGLPVRAPERSLVERFVASVGLDVNTEVATVPPRDNHAPAGLVAANAIMAGCRIDHFPVVLAALEAMCDPGFNLRGVQTTTNPAGPSIVVNGPVRLSAGYNGGASALGPGNVANAATGRALRLILLNLGGGLPGEVDLATQGWPGKYTFCFAENEEHSPWPPLHVARGFAAGDSCVTTTSCTGTTDIMGGDAVASEFIDKVAGAMRVPGANDYALGSGCPMLVLCPEHAQLVAKAGYTRESFRRALLERSVLPLAALGTHNGDLARKNRGAMEDRPLPIVDHEEHFLIVVAGGAGNHSTYVPSLGEGIPVTKVVRRHSPRS